MTSQITNKIALAAALCASAVLGEGWSAAQPGQSAHLSRQQAIEFAFAGLKTSGHPAEKFKVDSAHYQPDKHRWLVKFHELGPKVQFNSDLLAFVDDSTGLVCVKQASTVGRCT